MSNPRAGVLAAHAPQLNDIHVSAMLTRLARITNVAALDRRERIALRSLCKSITSLSGAMLTGFAPRHLANVLWALAKLDHYPGEKDEALNDLMVQIRSHDQDHGCAFAVINVSEMAFVKLLNGTDHVLHACKGTLHSLPPCTAPVHSQVTPGWVSGTAAR